MAKETRKFGDLSPREQRLVKSRYADVNGSSPAMNDPYLTEEDKQLIQDQASSALHKQGWLSSQEDDDSPTLTDVVFSILTLGIFGGN